MKKIYILILCTVFFGLHLLSLDILAQDCSQLSLPAHAISRLCIPGNRWAYDLEFSPDGKTLASLTDTRQLVLWDVENKTKRLTIDSVKGATVRYSPDGKMLVCGDVVYDATTLEPNLLLLDGDGYRDYVIYSPDGKTLAGAGSKGIRFWKSNIDEPTTDALPVGDTTITVLPTGTTAVSTGNGETDPTSVPFATSSTTVPGIRAIDYSPDGTELAIACRLGVWIYSTELNSEVALHKIPDQVFSVAYSPEGDSILAGDHHNIHIYDKNSETLRDKIWIDSWTISSLIFQDDNIFISGDRYGIHFFDNSSLEYKRTLSNEGINSDMEISPDRNLLAAAGDDRTILLYDLTSYPIVSISPNSVTSPTVGTELNFVVNITRGKNLSGYQATIEYDPDSLEYVETKYGDFLSGGVPVQPIVSTRNGTIQLAALSLTGVESNGDGVLATIKVKVIADRASKLSLRDVILTNNNGSNSYAWIDGAEILKSITTEDGEITTCSTVNRADVNRDCVVNIQDLVLVATKFGYRGNIPEDVNSDGTVNIVDLVLVAGAFGTTSDAPSVFADTQDVLSAYNVQQWLREARKIAIDDPAYRRGILILEQLLITSSPQKTVLLPNYPNPFNPETWIPYHLAKSADVSISIYAGNGELVRKLELGHQAADIYQSRSRAAYWDGKNALGESVASDVYFYTLSAGNFSATRKMLILK